MGFTPTLFLQTKSERSRKKRGRENKARLICHLSRDCCLLVCFRGRVKFNLVLWCQTFNDVKFMISLFVDKMSSYPIRRRCQWCASLKKREEKRQRWLNGSGFKEAAFCMQGCQSAEQESVQQDSSQQLMSYLVLAAPPRETVLLPI